MTDFQNHVEVTEELFATVKAGNQDAISKLITGHMRVAEALARKHSRGYRQIIAELTSVAYLGLVEAVANVSRSDADHTWVTAYLIKCMNNHIADYFRNKPLIHVPHTSDHEQFEPISLVEIETLEELHPTTNDRARVSAVDADDLLDSLHLSDECLEVIRLRMEGHTLSDIGEQYGKSPAWPSMHIREVGERLMRKGVLCA